MSEADIQVVSNEAGEPTAVIVHIALWKEISSERETAYLLKSETMRQRLRAAMDRGSGVSLDDGGRIRIGLTRFASSVSSETRNAIPLPASVSPTTTSPLWPSPTRK